MNQMFQTGAVYGARVPFGHSLIGHSNSFAFWSLVLGASQTAIT
jgi:hypothetical protein